MAFATRSFRDRIPALVLLMALPFWAGSHAEAGPGPNAGSTENAVAGRAGAPLPAEVQGRIEATIDGEHITWYSVSGQSSGSPYSSSSWLVLSESEHMIAIGGFVTDDPPLDSFEWSDSGMPASYGTYEGSVFAIAIGLTPDQSGFSVTLPDPDGSSQLSYQAQATLENIMANTFMMSAGTLSVTEAGIAGDLAHASGTFSGTFRSMDGARTVEITDGTFDVRQIPNVEAIRR